MPAAIALASDVGAALPQPGAGGTAHLWSALATLGAADLTVARVVEPHLDALAILAQAGARPRRAPGACTPPRVPGTPLQGHAGRAAGGRSRPQALVLAGRAARPRPGQRLGRGGAPALRGRPAPPGRRPVAGTWVARGLPDVDSGPVDLDAVPAHAVGEAGWYLERPGFAWGGIGVAACWYGGAVGVARRMLAAATGGREPDQVALMHLGAVDVVLHAAAVRCWPTRRAAVDAGRAAARRARGRAARRQVGGRGGGGGPARAAHALGPARWPRRGSRPPGRRPQALRPPASRRAGRGRARRRCWSWIRRGERRAPRARAGSPGVPPRRGGHARRGLVGARSPTPLPRLDLAPRRRPAGRRRRPPRRRDAGRGRAGAPRGRAGCG